LKTAAVDNKMPDLVVGFDTDCRIESTEGSGCCSRRTVVVVVVRIEHTVVDIVELVDTAHTVELAVALDTAPVLIVFV
jgi:hypothetical protein